MTLNGNRIDNYADGAYEEQAEEPDEAVEKCRRKGRWNPVIFLFSEVVGTDNISSHRCGQKKVEIVANEQKLKQSSQSRSDVETRHNDAPAQERERYRHKMYQDSHHDKGPFGRGDPIRLGAQR